MGMAKITPFGMGVRNLRLLKFPTVLAFLGVGEYFEL
jgi:hypothetical protein